MKTKNYLQIFFYALLIITLTMSCGSDNDSPSKEETALKEQEAEFVKLKSIIAGEWEAYQYYNTSVYHPTGWQPISQIHWDTGYIFNSDGTYIEHSIIGDSKGTYRLEKNPTYAEWPGRKCKVFIYFKRDDYSSETQKMIWLDDDYIRLDYATLTDQLPADAYADGEGCIRYKKK